MSSIVFEPTPGQIITKRHVGDTVFKSEKEAGGYAQISDVVAVGSEYTDDHGNIRKSPCKVGDIILNSYPQNDYELNFEKYRVIHFSMVLGVAK